MIYFYKSIYLILGAIFVLKIIFNLGVPYHLIKLRNEQENAESSGVSVMLGLELGLLALLITVAYFIEDEFILFTPQGALLYGGGVILFSYLHCFIVCGIYFSFKK